MAPAAAHRVLTGMAATAAVMMMEKHGFLIPWMLHDGAKIYRTANSSRYILEVFSFSLLRHAGPSRPTGPKLETQASRWRHG
jgi:hypothetical protein